MSRIPRLLIKTANTSLLFIFYLRVQRVIEKKISNEKAINFDQNQEKYFSDHIVFICFI